MPWIVGIDEAGYGPNLGPFVMSVVACGVHPARAGADLWDEFQEVVRRHSDPVDSRFVVADSKAVFSQQRGMATLEHAVHSVLTKGRTSDIAALLDFLTPHCHADVRREVWYHGTTSVPRDADPSLCSAACEAFSELCNRLPIKWGHIRSHVVCPAAFNAILDRYSTKGAVLALSLVSLLRSLPSDGDDVYVCIDKHGGRNSYAAQLQPAFDGGLVIARQEGSEESTYCVEDGGRNVTITIRPRADANHFCVALASMVSKYVRELLMVEFNEFWLQKVPGLKPTAGYPSDASRYWADILPAVRSLGLADDTLWRRK